MTDLEYLKTYAEPSKLEEGINQLEEGIPVQYIVGNVNFYGNTIKVNNSVLIPRFETEELVEKTLKYLSEFTNPDIVDIGTGSGCIAITIKKEIECNMDAVDISIDAINVALDNASANDVTINFMNGDLLSPLNKKYDCIISNPPYISDSEEIMDIVKNNEPALALYASNNGLDCYIKILKNVKQYLKEKYLIAFEIGYKQGEAICTLVHKYLSDSECTIEKDLSGKDRFIFIRNKR